MELLDSRTTYEGFVADVKVKRYRRAGGSEVERQVIEHPGSVAILAHDAEVVYLVRQPREAVEDDGLLEIPAGTLDVTGEGELECAKRELAEEVGLAAAEWSLLKAVYPSPGFVSERATIFEATGLSAAAGIPTRTRKSRSCAGRSPTSTGRSPRSRTRPLLSRCCC